MSMFVRFFQRLFYKEEPIILEDISNYTSSGFAKIYEHLKANEKDWFDHDYFVTMTNLNIRTVRQHLTQIRRAGLVDVRKSPVPRQTKGRCKNEYKWRIK